MGGGGGGGGLLGRLAISEVVRKLMLSSFNKVIF